jgi:hypothetical protein
MELLAMEGLKIEDEQQLVDSDIKEAYNEIKRKKNVFRGEHALNRYQTAYQKRKDINEIK